MDENKRIFSKRPGLEKNLIVPILAVAMLTGLAVWLVPDDEAENDTKKPLPNLGSVIQPLDSGGSVIRPLNERANNNAGSSISSDGGDVRSLITQLQKEGGNSSQKAFEEAEMRRRVGDNENAYLLYFFAAKQGHGEAALVLGTQSDPTYYTSINSALDAPDPGQAIKWYRIAMDAGNKDAIQNLAELTKRIKQQAKDGSSQAKRLMLQLQ